MHFCCHYRHDPSLSNGFTVTNVPSVRHLRAIILLYSSTCNLRYGIYSFLLLSLTHTCAGSMSRETPTQQSTAWQSLKSWWENIRQIMVHLSQISQYLDWVWVQKYLGISLFLSNFIHHVSLLVDFSVLRCHNHQPPCFFFPGKMNLKASGRCHLHPQLLTFLLEMDSSFGSSPGRRKHPDP